MEATVDSAGRLLLPKALRDELGLVAGSKVDISQYGGAVQITPGGRTARVKRAEDGHLVAKSETTLTDEALFALIDAVRR